MPTRPSPNLQERRHPNVPASLKLDAAAGIRSHCFTEAAYVPPSNRPHCFIEAAYVSPSIRPHRLHVSWTNPLSFVRAGLTKPGERHPNVLALLKLDEAAGIRSHWFIEAGYVPAFKPTARSTEAGHASLHPAALLH
jgi:hypothetical protein